MERQQRDRPEGRDADSRHLSVLLSCVLAKVSTTATIVPFDLRSVTVNCEYRPILSSLAPQPTLGRPGACTALGCRNVGTRSQANASNNVDEITNRTGLLASVPPPSHSARTQLIPVRL